MSTNHISCHVDRLRCCQLRWTVSVINWWRWLITSLSHWRSISVYKTVGVRHRVARVCQQHRRIVFFLALGREPLGRSGTCFYGPKVLPLDRSTEEKLKKPVQRPTLAKFSWLVPLTFDPNISGFGSWNYRTHRGTLLCHVWWSWLLRFLTCHAEKQTQTTSASNNPTPPPWLPPAWVTSIFTVGS